MTTHAQRKDQARDNLRRVGAHLAARLGPLATAELLTEAARDVLVAELERAKENPPAPQGTGGLEVSARPA
jgi:hypothetical protein